MTNGYRQYRQNRITTASPLQLVVLCYDGAIQNILAARRAWDAGDYKTRAEKSSKAYEIIGELLCSLRDEGGEITKNLRALYLYVLRRLLEASTGRDMSLYDEPLRILEELRSAWATIAGQSDTADKAAASQGLADGQAAAL